MNMSDIWKNYIPELNELNKERLHDMLDQVSEEKEIPPESISLAKEIVIQMSEEYLSYVIVDIYRVKTWVCELVFKVPTRKSLKKMRFDNATIEDMNSMYEVAIVMGFSPRGIIVQSEKFIPKNIYSNELVHEAANTFQELIRDYYYA